MEHKIYIYIILFVYSQNKTFKVNIHTYSTSKSQCVMKSKNDDSANHHVPGRRNIY